MSFRGQIVSFRADASLRLGTGHVMRCLALADELRRRGAISQFICREQPGDLIREILARGYAAHSLMASADDEEATGAILAGAPSGWVVVDHYSLGRPWESAIRRDGRRVVAIDDLADRSHDCDVLVDQNLGRCEEHYRSLVPARCQILTGPRYALLRSEFTEWREFSLRRREGASLQHLFISMGGVDQLNVTEQIVDALQHSSLPSDCRVTIVLGPAAPSVDRVRQRAGGLPWPTEVIVNARSMAEIMANSDLAIGAAGGTAWERCCLGLPTIIIPIAENQRSGANALEEAGAAHVLDRGEGFIQSLPRAIEVLSRPKRLFATSLAARDLVDGLGAARVCQHLEIPG